jgi:glycosyltransferase involved in cell wall biosynthesis
MTARSLVRRLKHYPLGILLTDLREFIVNAPREMMSFERRLRSFKPSKPSIGHVLVCYSNIAFFVKRENAVQKDHSNRWESLQIVKTFLELGYHVDVINENNHRFVPYRKYSIFFGNRTNFHRIAPLLNEDCIKILYIDTRHWLFSNMAELRRLEALQKRRGFVLPAKRTMMPDLAIEHADYAIALGNESSLNTYRYCRTPIFRMTVSPIDVYPWQDDKDFEAARRNYLWLGSHGFVHKGLDLVLEAFAGMPEYRLKVCGPLHVEKDFQRAYHKELYETPNIQSPGRIDVTTTEFATLTKNCVGLVFPSSSEGLSGSVVTCMHSGLIPLVSEETGVDVDATHGVILKTCSVEEIQRAVRSLSRLAPQRLRAMAKRNWELARVRYTQEIFASTFSSVLLEIVAHEKSGVPASAAARSEFAQLSRSSGF